MPPSSYAKVHWLRYRKDTCDEVHSKLISHQHLLSFVRYGQHFQCQLFYLLDDQDPSTLMSKSAEVKIVTNKKEQLNLMRDQVRIQFPITSVPVIKLKTIIYGLDSYERKAKNRREIHDSAT